MDRLLTDGFGSDKLELPVGAFSLGTNPEDHPKLLPARGGFN